MENKMYSFSICVDNIPDTHKAIGKDGKIYLNNLILANKKEVDKFGKDVTIFASQSKEDREANKPKNYCGSGKTIK